MAQTYTEESTLKALAAGAAIAELTARYNRAYETGDRAAWLATFLPEGVLEHTGGPVLSGHAELGRFFAAQSHDGVLVTADAQISVDGVEGRQDCRFLLLVSAPDGSGVGVHAAGRIRDQLVYERGGWYFAKRVVTVDLPCPSLDGRKP